MTWATLITSLALFNSTKAFRQLMWNTLINLCYQQNFVSMLYLIHVGIQIVFSTNGFTTDPVSVQSIKQCFIFIQTFYSIILAALLHFIIVDSFSKTYERMGLIHNNCHGPLSTYLCCTMPPSKGVLENLNLNLHPGTHLSVNLHMLVSQYKLCSQTFRELSIS